MAKDHCKQVLTKAVEGHWMVKMFKAMTMGWEIEGHCRSIMGMTRQQRATKTGHGAHQSSKDILTWGIHCSILIKCIETCVVIASTSTPHVKIAVNFGIHNFCHREQIYMTPSILIRYSFFPTSPKHRAKHLGVHRLQKKLSYQLAYH